MSPLLEGVAIGIALAAGGIFLNSCRTAIRHPGSDDLVGHSACGLLGMIAGLGFGTPVLALLDPAMPDPQRTATAALAGLLVGGLLCALRRTRQSRRPA